MQQRRRPRLVVVRLNEVFLRRREGMALVLHSTYCTYSIEDTLVYTCVGYDTQNIVRTRTSTTGIMKKMKILRCTTRTRTSYVIYVLCLYQQLVLIVYRKILGGGIAVGRVGVAAHNGR